MSRPIHTDTRVLRPIVEALIFASEEPLAPRLLVRLLAGERDDPKAAAAEEAAAPSDEAPPSAPSEDAPTEDAPEETPGDAVETTFPDEAVVAAPVEALPVETAVDTIEQPAEAVTDAIETVDAPAETVEDESAVHAGVAVLDESSGADAASALAEQRIEVGDGWLEQEIGVDPDRPADGSESAAELASTYAGLTRDYSERLFPDEQILTIDQRVVRKLIDDLNAEYEETGRAFRIVEVAGGFQFATIREYGEYVALLSKEKQRRRLSPAALETLAIIAFRQPISKPEIEAIRGVNSDQVLLSLLEKNLVAITGRSESVGRPLLYGTAEEFLRIFGLNTLNELPKLREIEELMEEDAYSAERIEVVTVDPSSDAEQIEALVGAAGGDPAADATEPAESPESDAGAEAPAESIDADADADVDAVDVAEDLDDLAATLEPAPEEAALDADEGGDESGDDNDAELDEAIADPNGAADDASFDDASFETADDAILDDASFDPADDAEPGDLAEGGADAEPGTERPD